MDVYTAALLAAHAGQSLDIQGHAHQMDLAVAAADPRPLLETLRLTHRLKSGAVEGACLRIAALAGGASPAVQHALNEYGTAVGCAYQISDDVCDLTGVPRAGQATKRVGEDLLNGKVTMPLAHAVGLLPRRRTRHLWDEVARGTDAAGVRRIAEELRACGAVDACADEALSTLERAWRRLAPLLPDTADDNEALHAIARHAIRRNLSPTEHTGPEPTGP
ncbi:polyprenyl synthetase family protein [Streptomyces sp. CRN 30]|uniref:polyprenyl synthetase family protein n=1 Tax=Streptomyces sp. CRN 30 TaxID=3075613 RepID=UPI002A7ED74D|nr:polyprenyl synthetase family protein [Streptomyces sp. CRN 30]